MRKKQLKQEKPKPEIKQPEIKQSAFSICEVTDLFKANELVKQGWVVTGIKSAQIGVRPKTWLLRKEQ